MITAKDPGAMDEDHGDDIEREIAAAVLRSRLFGDAPPRIGRLELIERLGQGAFGLVWRAYDPQIERSVAIKIFRRPDVHLGTRRIDEARAQASVVHPNVATVYDVGLWRRRAYVVMELVEGLPLREWVSVRPLDVSRVLDVVAGAGRGLAAVHERGLIHGDVKPENIVVEPGDVAKLLDFGVVSGESAGTGGSPSATHRIIGTLQYMSPEVARGDGQSSASDQYALALTLHEALGGERPPQSPVRRNLRRRIRAVNRRALSAAPGERYPSVASFLEALARARRGHWPKVALVLGAGAAAAMVATWSLGGDAPRCSTPSVVVKLAKAEVPASLVSAVKAGFSDPKTRISDIEARARTLGQGWSETSRATCSDPARRRCFEEAVTGLRGSISALESSGPDDALVGVFVDLSTPTYCAVDPPILPPRGSGDEAHLRRLGELQVALELDRFEAVIAGTTTLLGTADVRADLAMRARLLRGRAHSVRNEVALAESDLERALEMAKSSGRHRDAVMIVLSVSQLRLREGRLVENSALLDAAALLAHRLQAGARDEAVFNVRLAEARQAVAMGDPAGASEVVATALREYPDATDGARAVAASVASRAASELDDHVRASVLALDGAELLAARYGEKNVSALMSLYNAALESFMAGDAARARMLVERASTGLEARGELDMPHAWLPRELDASLRLYRGDLNGAKSERGRLYELRTSEAGTARDALLARVQWAEALREVGDHDRAIEVLEPTVVEELSSTLPALDVSTAWIELSRAYASVGQTDRADALLGRARDLIGPDADPSCAWMSELEDARARLAVARGEFTRAREALERAVQCDEPSVAAVYRRQRARRLRATLRDPSSRRRTRSTPRDAPH